MRIHKVAGAINPGGKFLFTAPQQAVRWQDAPTGRDSVPLGAVRYRHLLCGEGLVVDGEQNDEGDNHAYLVSKL